jgi:tetratricopeptide (TPR) repeat protein
VFRNWNASRRRLPADLALVILGAALFRAIYLFAYARTGVLFDGMMLDAAIYDTWAQAIAAGAWMGREAFYFAPLYPYLLGALFRLLGHSYAIVYVLQGLIGLGTILLIHAIGARLYGRRAGLLAAAGAVLYLPMPFFETKILGATLGLFLGLLALRLLIGAEGARTLKPWLVAGLVLGLAASVTPAVVLLAGLYAVVLTIRRRPGAAAALGAGTLIALLPILVHNVTVAGDWIFLSGQGGVTFYQGNNPDAAGLFMPPPGFTGSPEQQPEEEKALAEREAGHALRRSEVSAHFFRKGLAFVTGSPVRWLGLEARKLGRLIGSYEPSTEYSLYLERERIPLLWVACLPFAAIVGAAAGAWVMHPRSGGGDRVEGGRKAAEAAAAAEAQEAAGRQALALYAVYAAAVPLLFYVSSRYRLPLVPALLIYGGSFLDRMVGTLRGGASPDPAAIRGMLAALGVGLLSFFPLGRSATTVEANAHYNLSRILADRGRNEEALVELDRCLRDWPEHVYALVNRGNSLDRLGRTDEALASYQRAEEVRPDFWKAYQAQGSVLYRQQQFDQALDAYRRGAAAGGSESWFLQATVLQEMERPDEAERAVRQAIAMNGRDARYYNTLGMVLEKQDKRDDAIGAFTRANTLDARYVKSRYNLASLYFDQKLYGQAQAQLVAALQIDPNYTRARVKLGDILMRLGDEKGALLQYHLAAKVGFQDDWARAAQARIEKMGHQ